MVLDLPGERACDVAEDLGEPLSSAGVGRVMAAGWSHVAFRGHPSAHLGLLISSFRQ